ncbi:uncharacterized protein [Amphiura filiformis]|uniref:uncharacterized protein n=1 Tax=Amphiura filiformis TaxID=82378 RepID=UPI003B21A85C
MSHEQAGPSEEQENRPVSGPTTTITKEVISSTINEAVGGLKSYFEGAINNIKRDSEKKYTATSSEFEKFKKSSELQLKGNQAQFQFNQGVVSKLQAAVCAFQEGEVREGKDTVEEVIEEVQKRNKLIRIADKSDAGWKAVDEYLRDDIADDSDDEKKIRQAQARASRKRKATARPNPKRGRYNRDFSMAGSVGSHDLFVAINRGIDRNLGVQETRHGTPEAGQNRPITVSAVDNWGIGGETAQPEQVQQTQTKKVPPGASGSNYVESDNCSTQSRVGEETVTKSSMDGVTKPDGVHSSLLISGSEFNADIARWLRTQMQVRQVLVLGQKISWYFIETGQWNRAEKFHLERDQVFILSCASICP